MIERDWHITGEALDYYWENAVQGDWVDFYEQYKSTLAQLKKSRNKLVKRNEELKNETHKNVKYVLNKNKTDIYLLNSMINDITNTIMEIEMHLPYDMREFLHKRNDAYSKSVLEIRNNEGFNPDGAIKFPSEINVEKLIENEELQKILFDVMKLLCNDVQIKCVYDFFWENMKQCEIAEELDISQQAVAKNIRKSIEKMQNHLKYLDMKDFL